MTQLRIVRWKLAALIMMFTISINAFAQSAPATSIPNTVSADAEQALDAAKAADAPLLSPDTYARAIRALADAKDDLERGRRMNNIQHEFDAAAALFRKATETAAIAKVTLASLIKTRTDAANAHAEKFSPDTWKSAEESFLDATRRLESGDLRGAQRHAEKAESAYRDAELASIKAAYLSQTRALLARANDDRVPRYAPKTFAHAQALLRQAEEALDKNRYDTDLPRSLAQQANQEAKHAIFLAAQIRKFHDQDADTEDIILAYEAPLVSIAAAADKVVQLDRDVGGVAADLVAYIEQLRTTSRQAQRDLEDSRARVAELAEEVRDLDKRLGGVSQERVALIQKLEAEKRVREQFDTIGRLFSRDQALVSRESDTLVLRLVGLTFKTGGAAIGSADQALLEKVRRAINVFPRSHIVVEGHTDSYGSDRTNMTLSRDRAEAVKDYLASQLGVPAFRISAAGYGETRPIASNDTAEGRLRNRRIDIRIEPQIQ